MKRGNLFLLAIILGAGYCSPVFAESSDLSAPKDDTTAIPPDVLRQIRNQSGNLFIKPQSPKSALSVPSRILLALGAASLLAAGAIFIHHLPLKARQTLRDNYDTIFLGLFGAAAALIAACACTGYLFLHLAAALCTAACGFIIAILLAIHLQGFRTWISGHKAPDKGSGYPQ
jgi:hypothetical protein